MKSTLVTKGVRWGFLLSLVPIFGTLLMGCDDENPWDIQAIITIDQPTSEPEWTTASSSVQLEGTIVYSPRAYITNNRTGRTYTGIIDTATDPMRWSVEIPDLQLGENPITGQAHLYDSGSGYTYITITRTQ